MEIDSLDDLICNIKELMKKYFYPTEDVDDLIDAHKHEISDVNQLQSVLDGKANNDHTHPIDNKLKDDSEYPVQNKVVKSALDDKADVNHSHTIESIVNDSTNAVQSKAVNDALSDKADVSHTHTISNITNLQSTLDNKANKSEVPTVDSKLSENSTNPVQNKVINQALFNKADWVVATSETMGLMSAALFRKLDGITEGAKARKRVPGIYISSDKDKTNQNLITINKSTRLKVILFDQEGMSNATSTYYDNISDYQISNTSINYTINGVNGTVDSGSTIGINLEKGTYDMLFMFQGSGNYYQVYRAIKLRID